MAWNGLCGAGDTKKWNCVWPSMAKLVKFHAGRVSERSIRKGLRELEQKHWICYPFGNPGGRGTITICHLHPNGSACDGTEVDHFTHTKEFGRIRPFLPGARSAPVSEKGAPRAPFQSEKGAPQVQKGGTTGPKRGHLGSEKGAPQGATYKEVTPERTPERTPDDPASTSSTRARESSPVDSVYDADFVDDDDDATHPPVTSVPIQSPSAADSEDFELLEALLREALKKRSSNPRDKGAYLRDLARLREEAEKAGYKFQSRKKVPPLLLADARAIIRKGVAAAGLTLRHLAWLFSSSQAGDKYAVHRPKGLLIHYAKNLQDLAQGVDFPNCMQCWDGGGCSECERGRVEAREIEEALAIKEAQARESAERHQAGVRTTESDAESQRRWQEDREKKQKAEPEWAEADSNAPRDEGICGFCKGSKIYRNEECFACHGTGKYRPPSDKKGPQCSRGATPAQRTREFLQ